MPCDLSGIRTRDPQFRRLLLYPTELRGLLTLPSPDVIVSFVKLQSLKTFTIMKALWRSAESNHSYLRSRQVQSYDYSALLLPTRFRCAIPPCASKRIPAPHGFQICLKLIIPLSPKWPGLKYRVYCIRVRDSYISILITCTHSRYVMA